MSASQRFLSHAGYGRDRRLGFGWSGCAVITITTIISTTTTNNHLVQVLGIYETTHSLLPIAIATAYCLQPFSSSVEKLRDHTLATAYCYRYCLLPTSTQTIFYKWLAGKYTLDTP